MTERTMHRTSEQLQMLLDGRVTEAERKETSRHLQECSRCMAAYHRMEQLHQGLQKLPVATTGAAFTSGVMEKILPSARLSLAFRIVENLAYLFAVLIVTGIVAVVFVATGVIDSAQVSEGQGLMSAYASATGTWFSEALRGGAVWLERYLPVRSGANIMLAGAGILAALALLDRVVQRKLAHRMR